MSDVQAVDNNEDKIIAKNINGVVRIEDKEYGIDFSEYRPDLIVVVVEKPERIRKSRKLVVKNKRRCLSKPN